MRKQFIVTLDIPEGVSIGEMRQYIQKAVRVECGSYSILEPMSDLNRNSVKVATVTRCQVAKLAEDYLP